VGPRKAVGAAVPNYRAYIVGPDGHFIGVHEFTAPDRGEATKTALGYVNGHAVELWEGAERIGTFTPVKNSNPLLNRFRRPRSP
jgi:hypothetical protein